ncbi:MAG: peptidoglycan DD-metalloendopeptidase family protein [Burkholderia sp.]|nr:peptidoglycan DD-metalloendopeptidase family protein [Burkholderia sp.]
MKSSYLKIKQKLIWRVAIHIVGLTVLASCGTRVDNAPIFDLSNSFEFLTMASDNSSHKTITIPSLPGFYRVKPGDTLYRIAVENGENYSNLIKWNNIENPNHIIVDQLLRISPPDSSSTTQSTSVIFPTSKEDNTLSLTNNSRQIMFIWPTCGKVLNGFDEIKNKGINISGIAGQTVKATANGHVVYAGNSLRGYGNLIIIKHNEAYLTAYAHNYALMVKEGDIVRTGQKIAEMGNSDADHVMLHFEIRRYGKPVDPLKYMLPLK